MENKDFHISEKRRSVWNEELEIFEVFRDICERHDLKYFADSGTLLGAIRHSGFIPWDDDMDVAMLREDYDKFIEFAKDELQEPYFLQIPRSDDDYFYGHAKIRKNNTTAIRYIQYPEKYKHHQGVFVDIFPLDNIPDNGFKHKIHRFFAIKLMLFLYYSRYYYRLNSHSTASKIKHKLGQICIPGNRAAYRFYKFFEWWIKLPDKKKSKIVAYTSVYYYLEDQASFERAWYDNKTEVAFENTHISVPDDYDKVLKKSYGDYLTPVKAPNQHGDVFFDLEHDYREYYDGTRTFTFDDCTM